MASGVLVIPSVNRNFPRIVTQSHSGILAYASRNNIYFIDAHSNPPLVLDSKFIFAAHAGSIISLAYSKHETTELLVSIGDDREMKVWDVESQTCVQSTTVKHVSNYIFHLGLVLTLINFFIINLNFIPVISL